MTSVVGTSYESKLAFRRFAYLAPLLIALLPLISFVAAQATDRWMIAACLTPLVLFLVIPILDWLIGRDPSNPSQVESLALSENRFYRLLTMLCLPAYTSVLLFGVWVIATVPMSVFIMFGWTVSIGLIGGIVATNPAHELIHKASTIERLFGGTLLAMVSYGTFKIEHIAGHHVDVGTPKDAATASIGQSVFGFVLRAIAQNPVRAVQLERTVCNRRGLKWRWYTSELIRWALVSVIFSALCGLVVAEFAIYPPWVGIIYFFMQSLVAIFLLEIVNYIEHYGLKRQPLPPAHNSIRYEKVNYQHSWNTDFALSNALLLQLQRHSDHHIRSFRRYQSLRHHDDSPQLPAGYPTMILVALIPPLWFHIMNPRVPRGF